MIHTEPHCNEFRNVECSIVMCKLRKCFVMTSSNANIFRVTGLCKGNPPAISQMPVTRSFDVLFDLRLNKRVSKNRDAGDLRRRRAHCDVTVMF